MIFFTLQRGTDGTGGQLLVHFLFHVVHLLCPLSLQSLMLYFSVCILFYFCLKLILFEGIYFLMFLPADRSFVIIFHSFSVKTISDRWNGVCHKHRLYLGESSGVYDCVKEVVYTLYNQQTITSHGPSSNSLSNHPVVILYTVCQSSRN